MPTPMTKQYDAAYFERWYRDPALKDQAIGGSARLARKVAMAVATHEVVKRLREGGYSIPLCGESIEIFLGGN